MFTKILLKASKISIPQGRFKESIPNLPHDAAARIEERDRLREENPDSERIIALDQEIDEIIKQHKKARWVEKLEAIDHRTNPSSLWGLLQRLEGRRTDDAANAGIEFDEHAYTKPNKISASFNRFFSCVRPYEQNRLKRQNKRSARKQKLTHPQPYAVEFEQVKAAIKASKSSRAIGPDGLAAVHLKHLSDNGILYLTHLINLSFEKNIIPNLWKRSTIIPILKPGKDNTKSTSYRPISLLCPPVKIIERLICKELATCLPQNSSQHGFKAKHSTTTALTNLTHEIMDGFNQSPPERTIMVALDLTKAFDMVDIDLLCHKLLRTTLHPGLKSWLLNYLNGRQCRTYFRGQLSRTRIVKSGVPQGSCISPIVFNFYIHDMPPPPPGIKSIGYADDLSKTIRCKYGEEDEMAGRMTEYLAGIKNYLDTHKLSLSTTKSTVTYFTKHREQLPLHPNVCIDGVQLPNERNPKILGVTLDQELVFNKHADVTAAKMGKRNNALKCLSGTNYGCDKSTLRMTYRATGRALANYAAPVFASQIAHSSVQKIQRQQNCALRTISGCHLMTSEDQLHDECAEMKIRPHYDMLAKQWLASCSRADHPCHEAVSGPAAPRRVAKTIEMKWSRELRRNYLPDTPNWSDEEHKKILKRIHDDCSSSAISSLRDNPVLRERPPPLNSNEDNLPRELQRLGAQLRSGYCCKLKSYMHRIGEADSSACPKCRRSVHDTAHLFKCSEGAEERRRSGISDVKQLWTDPAGVMAGVSALLD